MNMYSYRKYWSNVFVWFGLFLSFNGLESMEQERLISLSPPVLTHIGWEGTGRISEAESRQCQQRYQWVDTAPSVK